MPADLRLGVPRNGAADLLRRQGLGGGLRRSARSAGRALGATLVEIRHRAVLRDRAPALRRPVGGRALPRHRAIAARVVAGRDPSGDARDHRRPARGRARPMPSPRFYELRGAAHASPSTPSPRSTRWCCRPRRRSTPIAQVLADPIELNSRLGTYTNFVNLLDLCGLAVPAAMRADGIPFGITLLAPAGQDALLAAHRPRLPCRHRLADRRDRSSRSRRSRRSPRALAGDEIAIAVVGAHLSGMALNGELTCARRAAAGSRRTAPDYRLYALPSTRRRSPACCASSPARASPIELEIWALSAGGVRTIRRRDPAAALDRHRCARRRPHA